MRGRVSHFKVTLEPDGKCFKKRIRCLTFVIEFEINTNGRTARCRLCPDAKWTDLGNAQKHTQSKKHQECSRKNNYVAKPNSTCSAAADKICEGPILGKKLSICSALC